VLVVVSPGLYRELVNEHGAMVFDGVDALRHDDLNDVALEALEPRMELLRDLVDCGGSALMCAIRWL